VCALGVELYRVGGENGQEGRNDGEALVVRSAECAALIGGAAVHDGDPEGELVAIAQIERCRRARDRHGMRQAPDSRS